MNESIDRVFADWLREGPQTGPQEGLERTLAATRRTAQRPGWTIPERWLPMQLAMSRTPSMRPVLLYASLILLLVAFVTAALYVGSHRPVPEPFGLARNGVVAYADGGDIVMADELGATPRVLIGGPTADRFPAFSRQGDRLAFVREGTDGLDLLVARADGSDVRVAMAGLQTFQGASWSPDGTRILVGYSERGLPKLAIAMADGSGSQTIEGTGPADLASWRPDGRQIVFRSQPGDGTQASAVYLADADGSNIHRLDLVGSKTAVGDFDGLEWSPDGTRLMYHAESLHIDDLGPQIHIVDVDADGGVVDHPMRFHPESTAEMFATWSPDGSSIAFILDRAGKRQIAITDAEGAAPVTMIGPSVDQAMAGLGRDWSPDGKTLLISVWPRSGEPTSWSVDLETGTTTAIEGVVIDLPSWQRRAP